MPRLTPKARAARERRDWSLVPDIARAFADKLKAWLSADEMKQVVWRNRREDSRHVCHSQDFCDANMAMLPGFQRILGRRIKAASQHDSDIWAAAWAHAMRCEFWTTVPPEVIGK